MVTDECRSRLPLINQPLPIDPTHRVLECPVEAFEHVADFLLVDDQGWCEADGVATGQVADDQALRFRSGGELIAGGAGVLERPTRDRGRRRVRCPTSGRGREYPRRGGGRHTCRGVGA